MAKKTPAKKAAKAAKPKPAKKAAAKAETKSGDLIARRPLIKPLT